MPVLDAKALDTDPEGMAFLRSVIRPTFEQEEVASPPVSPVDLKRQSDAAPPVESDAVAVQASAGATEPLPVG
jgi:hypothetical protein